MESIQYAVIGGSGIYDSGTPAKQKLVKTEFGEVEVDIVAVSGMSVAFLARHGREHGIPPHRINYRANLRALQMLDVQQILSTAAVGSLNPDYPSGSLVLLTDFLDMTRQRRQTFFEPDSPIAAYSKGVRHVNMDDPYCGNLRGHLRKAAKCQNVKIAGNAVYVCTEGPRFETAAEIRMMRQSGADVVGMTNIPEVVLAKELGLCYATVGLVVNMATGLESGPIQLEEIETTLIRNKEKITRMFLDVFEQLPPELSALEQKNCGCADSVVCL